MATPPPPDIDTGQGWTASAGYIYGQILAKTWVQGNSYLGDQDQDKIINDWADVDK